MQIPDVNWPILIRVRSNYKSSFCTKCKNDTMVKKIHNNTFRKSYNSKYKSNGYWI